VTEQGTTRIRARASTCLATVVLATSLLVGCGSGDSENAGAPRGASTSASPYTPRPAHHRHHPTDCLAGRPRHDVTGPGKRPVDLRLVGRGRAAVVLSNQSNVDLCAWQGEAARLHRRGYLVALYDYTSGTADDLASVVRYLRAHGVSRIALMGASLGATTSVVVAGQTSPDVLITLSADATTGGAPAAIASRHVTCPSLYVASRGDTFGAAGTSKLYAARSPSAGTQVLMLGGSTHGIALLLYPRVRKAVDSFLTHWLPVHGV
jgi:dienelactone hydrolase